MAAQAAGASGVPAGDKEAAAKPWQEAFLAVQQQRDFAPLAALLEPGAGGDGISASFEFSGRFLTPLFAAVELGLEDLIPKLLALGADPNILCFYEGFLCGPLHAAALRQDVLAMGHLLDFLGPAGSAGCLAETSVLGHEDGVKLDGEKQGVDYVGCNALHVLILRDIWCEEAYRLLLRRGVPLTAACRVRGGAEVNGLLLPRKLGCKSATEEQLDLVLGDEVRYIISHARFANQLNSFLELCSALKREHGLTAYRCSKDVDFHLDGASLQPLLGQDEEPATSLLFSAVQGNADALRLLLYAGADAGRTAQRCVAFSAGRAMTVPAQAVHLALLKHDLEAVGHLLFFGVSPDIRCSGSVHHQVAAGAGVGVQVGDVQERWQGLGLVHLAVIDRSPDLIAELLKRECPLEAVAAREVAQGPAEEHTPLRLAVLLGEVRCTSRLLDLGAHVSEVIRADACMNEAVCEMFGGPSVIGIEDWVCAMLTGEPALQRLLDRRTDLARVLDFPEGSAAAELLQRHRLASPDLVAQLCRSLETSPTAFRGVRPAHLACLLQQPWAVAMLADAGAPIGDAAPCSEVPLAATGLEDSAGLAAMPLDVVFLCVRIGGLRVLEMLCTDARFQLDVNREVPLSPDITPHFFPQRETQLAPTWAWSRLGPLELALLHRRVDMAVLLVRMGADLVHTVDHVSINPPSHYSVTDMCFRGLTPLHLCALLDLGAAAAALLNEACPDKGEVVPNEFQRAKRQEMLSVGCVQGWATVESQGCSEKEQWLWRDLTPLHLAILQKHYAVAELLVDVSTAETLGKLCISRDVSGDSERSFSALLMAYENNQKDLHRKIAKKFPTC